MIFDQFLGEPTQSTYSSHSYVNQTEFASNKSEIQRLQSAIKHSNRHMGIGAGMAAGGLAGNVGASLALKHSLNKTNSESAGEVMQRLARRKGINTVETDSPLQSYWHPVDRYINSNKKHADIYGHELGHALNQGKREVKSTDIQNVSRLMSRTPGAHAGIGAITGMIHGHREAKGKKVPWLIRHPGVISSITAVPMLVEEGRASARSLHMLNRLKKKGHKVSMGRSAARLGSAFATYGMGTVMNAGVTKASHHAVRNMVLTSELNKLKKLKK